MAIGYFPELLPDELFYSALARYNYDTGNSVYRNFARLFFDKETARADIEYINKLNTEAYHCITKITNIDEIIHCHTMADYYLSFVPQERRERAYTALRALDAKSYRQRIPMPHGGSDRVLRYCPVCAERDRERYGFTYWHRSAQMIGVPICPMHHCYLQDTEISISSSMSPTIVSAEELIPINDEETIKYANSKGKTFAAYCFSVFQRMPNFASETEVKEYLQYRLVGTPYLSARKLVRNMDLLYNDLANYTQGTILPLPTPSQLEQVFKGVRFVPADICLLGMFLGISVDDLLRRHIPERAMENTVDDEIKRLHREGYNYAQIARKVGMGYDVVKLIDYGRYGATHKPYVPPKRKGTLLDWAMLDDEYLPRVKHEIRQMERTDAPSRPKFVCPATVSKLVGLPEQRIFKMPKCLAYIQAHQCSRDVYNARVIDWGKKQLAREGLPMTVNAMCKKTNLKREIVNMIFD